MSLNYYLSINECECCGRCDSIHIGQAARGWKFLFQSMYGDDDLGIPNLKSMQDWKQVIKTTVCDISDEYGYEIPKDEFLKMINNMQDDKSRVEAANNSTMYIDSEGYEFHKGDFS